MPAGPCGPVHLGRTHHRHGRPRLVAGSARRKAPPTLRGVPNAMQSDARGPRIKRGWAVPVQPEATRQACSKCGRPAPRAGVTCGPQKIDNVRVPGRGPGHGCMPGGDRGALRCRGHAKAARRHEPRQGGTPPAAGITNRRDSRARSAPSACHRFDRGPRRDRASARRCRLSCPWRPGESRCGSHRGRRPTTASCHAACATAATPANRAAALCCCCPGCQGSPSARTWCRP